MLLRIKMAVLALFLWTYTAPPAVSADTLLAPGDVINVQVFQEATLTQLLTIAPDGSIVMALLGRIVVAGLSTTQAQTAIREGLLRYVRNPIVSVALQNQALYDVLVLGNVKTPGRYKVPPGARLSDAIAAAGGLNPITGAFPDAHVTSGTNAIDVSLDALLRRGDMTQNVAMSPGAGVYIPGPVVFRVRVLGAVDHPGDVELNAGDGLSVAIAKAGDSPNSHADLNHIRVTHNTPDGHSTVKEINLYRALEGGDPSADVALANNDVVYVPEAAKKNDGTDFFSVVRRILLPF